MRVAWLAIVIGVFLIVCTNGFIWDMGGKNTESQENNIQSADQSAEVEREKREAQPVQDDDDDQMQVRQDPNKFKLINKHFIN